MTRSPYGEMQQELSAKKMYPSHRDFTPYEGVELDIAMDRSREQKNTRVWAAGQTRGVHRELQKRQ